MKVLQIHPGDNVAVALEALSAGSEVQVLGAEEATRVRVLRDIPFAHKVAIRPITRGDSILKYGAPIGFATTDIAPGDWVHTHNVQSSFAARHGERKS